MEARVKTGEERRAIHEEFRHVDEAFREGDMDALRAALGNPDDFPNTLLPLASFGPGGDCLEYAIYHSPLPFIRALLEVGADPNPPDHVHIGFPPLIAALSCVRSVPGSTARRDATEILALLLSFGADPNQRGLNDWTALHMAAAQYSPDAIRILLEGGADPALRTRIDECLTAREEAERAGLREIAELLAAAETGRRGAP